MTETGDVHREALDLLPWYVNGTLPEKEREHLDAHFRECLPCHAALREERKLKGMLLEQDVLPLGPGHGLNALLDRIDGRPRRARPVARLVPWIGYGLAAGLGGGIVWFWLALAPIGGGDRGEGAFETLSTPATTEATPSSAATPSVAAPAAAQIDVVFAAAVSGTELEAFGREIGATFVAGPSEIGRYRFALDAAGAARIDAVLETLRRDPRIRFAGRGYADVNVGGTVTESPGEAR